MLFFDHYIYKFLFDRAGPSRLARMVAATVIGASVGLIVLIGDLHWGWKWRILAIVGGGVMGFLAALLLTIRDVLGERREGSMGRGVISNVLLMLVYAVALGGLVAILAVLA
jgi:hypothetical protein